MVIEKNKLQMRQSSIPCEVGLTLTNGLIWTFFTQLVLVIVLVEIIQIF